MIRRLPLLIGAVALLFANAAAALDYPVRPVKLIVPFAPGGTTDIVGRVVAEGFSERLGKSFVVENRGGSGGVLGVEQAANAANDGYTLLLGTSGSIGINPSLYTKLPYDYKTAFQPIGLIAQTPNLVVVNPAVPAQTLADLIKLGKTKPGELAYASAGSGATSHLAAALLGFMAGIEMVHVPYRGTGPAMQDLLAGRVQVFVNNMPPLLPQVQSGALRALAVASPLRSAMLPNVPSAAEAGLPGYEVTGWFGLLAPSGTPQPIVTLLHGTLTQILGSDLAKKRLLDGGAEPEQSESPQAFATFINAEIERWGEVVRRSGAKVE